MSYAYLRDDVRRRLTLTFTGPLDVAEIVASMDRQAADGLWAYAVLVDARDRLGAGTAAEIQRLADHQRRLTREHGARGPVAVVTNEPAQFGMGRMFGTFVEMDGAAFGAFREITAAERWLDQQQAGTPPPA